MQILTHCWEAEEVVTELTEVLQFNKFIRWILKFKMLSLSFKLSNLLSMYDFVAPRFLWWVGACEPGQLRRHRRQSAISVSRWTLTHLQGFISFCLRPIVESDIIATIFSWLSSQSAWHLLVGQALRPWGWRGGRLQLQQLRARRCCLRSQLRCCQLWHVNKKTNKTEKKLQPNFAIFNTLFKRHSSQLKQS